MAVQYTTTELVAAIKRRGSIPTNQQLFTADDFIALANDEMETVIVPNIMSVMEEYFVTYEDFIIPSQSIPYEFEIPSDAVGQKFRDLCWVGTNGSLSSIPRLELEQASGDQWDSPRISGFMVRGNKIVLYPTSLQGTGTIRLFYFTRPLQLTSTSNAGKVTSINTSTNEVTLSFVPNSWLDTDSVSVVGASQPFETKVKSVAITSISSPTITLASVENISVGDWIALEGYSPIPQIPVEAHKVLAQATVVKCMEAMGDREGGQVAYAKLKKDIENMYKMINPRVDGAPKKITTNGNSVFDWNRSGKSRRW